MCTFNLFLLFPKHFLVLRLLPPTKPICSVLLFWATIYANTLSLHLTTTTLSLNYVAAYFIYHPP